VCGAEADVHSRAENTPATLGWDGQDERTPLEYVLDRPPVLLPAATREGWLTGADSPEDRLRLGYDTECRPPTADRVASVWGLRLVCCVGDRPRRVLVAAATHKSALRPPSLAVAREMGALTAITLAPGDVLFAAATALVGLPARDGGAPLLECLLVEQQYARPPRHAVRELPAELTEAQRELMTPPGLRARPPVPASVPEHAPEVDPELWFWDTFGYLIVRGVMAPGWLAVANAALAPDAGAERFAVTMDEEVQTSADCSPTIAALDASRHE
jgi:hypothetical protein